MEFDHLIATNESKEKAPNTSYQLSQPNANSQLISVADWHKAAAVLVAKGQSKTEIANRLDKDREVVDRLFTQDFFKDLVSAEIRQDGSFDELLRSLVVDSLMTLVSLRDDPRVAASVREKCASQLLNRALGVPEKSNKQIVTGEDRSNKQEDLGDRIGQLQLEIERQQEKLVT